MDSIHWQAFFFNPAVVWVLIPVTAIIVHGLLQFFRLNCRHEERLAMIRQGMIPPDDSEVDAEGMSANSPVATR